MSEIRRSEAPEVRESQEAADVGKREEQLELRLYVAGEAPNSVQAVANLRTICDRWLEPEAYGLEIIDVLAEPLRALDDGVLVTPTLVGGEAGSVSIVGTLSDHERVRQALGLGASLRKRGDGEKDGRGGGPTG